jgi:hypothetical protein
MLSNQSTDHALVEMADAWNGTWLTVAFLAALAALGLVGVGIDGHPARPGRRCAPRAAVLWGLFAAPQATFHVVVLAVLVKVLVFGSAVLALVATGHPRLAGALAVAALLGSVLSSPPATVPDGVSSPPSG